jgi:hypothetical protein
LIVLIKVFNSPGGLEDGCIRAHVAQYLPYDIYVRLDLQTSNNAESYGRVGHDATTILGAFVIFYESFVLVRLSIKPPLSKD